MSAPSAATDAYAELVRRWREFALLGSCADLLEWDEETHMPRGGAEHRSEQRRHLAALLHGRLTDPRVGELLEIVERSDLMCAEEASGSGGVNVDAIAANVRLMRREHDRQSRLPADLVGERARVATLAQQAWAQAREDADFEAFRPWLDRTVALCREFAAAIDGSVHPYDVLLDEHEPGATTADVSALFATLRTALAPLARAASGGRRRPRTAVLRREYAVDRQRLFAQAVAASLGFDLERGRLDLATHPFCTAIGPGDVRLALRFAERSFAEGFLTLLHEVGHGLYDQGLDAGQFGLAMGQAASLGIHESQSRLWENFVGRGLPFWTHFHGRLRNVFPEAVGDVGVESFVRALNVVEPSLERSRADEVTYNLHIFVRVELEVAMVEGRLAAADVPEAWREAYRRELGVEPRNDAEGCLQDGHWAQGILGYFPTYTLGNVYAAQLWAAARRDLPDLDHSFARGNFADLLNWLRQRVHRHGRRWMPRELIRRATGEEPDARALLAHLESRHGG